MVNLEDVMEVSILKEMVDQKREDDDQVQTKINKNK